MDWKDTWKRFKMWVTDDGPRGLARQRVYNDISEERAYQDAKYGGFTKDDRMSPTEWHALLITYLYNANDACVNGDREEYRRQMIKVAALAVATIESHDRKNEVPFGVTV